jgi:hypothetical protein
MRKTRSAGFTLVAVLVLQLACSSFVPATVTRRAAFPLDRESPVFVIAERQRDAIVDSLERAGVQVAPDFSNMRYALEVKLGGNRGRTGCGTIHNVSYVLTGLGQRLLVIKGRGETGTCNPSIFDEMSRELAANMN